MIHPTDPAAYALDNWPPTPVQRDLDQTRADLAAALTRAEAAETELARLETAVCSCLRRSHDGRVDGPPLVRGLVGLPVWGVGA